MAKHRVAVIGRTGHGNYGHGLDVCWLGVPRAEIVAVSDDNPTGLEVAAKKLRVERTFADYRKMLDEVKPEIVTICQRTLDQHHEMALACLERGVHIFIEKPFTRTLAEADALVAAAERTHAKVVISHQTHYSPRVEIAKQIIADGKIGRVLEYRARGKEDARGGGEDLWVLGTHLMDLLRQFAGHPQWCFATVTTLGRPITATDVVQGNEGIGPLAGDSVRAMYGMKDGSTAYFASQKNMADKGSRFGLQIYGSAGVIEFLMGHTQPTIKLLADPTWSPGRSGKAWQEVTTAGIGQPEPLKDGSLGAGNVAICNDLLDAIEQSRDTKCTVYDARAAVEMIVAVFESQRLGRPVTLPLENRQNPLTMLGS